MAGKKMPYVVVRTYSAGVHVGELADRRAKEVDLVNARRIWRWNGANTLHEIANHGVDTKASKVSEPVAAITLTEAVEILTCTAEGEKALKDAKWSAD